ncbi:MAG: plasmid mobilization protein [Streptosporangiaceae bacterium]
MSDYGTRAERSALEADFDQLPSQRGTSAGEVSTVVSVRLRGDELAAVERAAAEADMPLSTFIRQAALGAASPLDVRAASARAEAIQKEARKLIALLHGEAA